MPKPVDRHRLFRRRRAAGDSDWASTIPSAYEISFLNASCEPRTGAATTSIESFNRYVEGQRRTRSLTRCRSLKDMTIELVLNNLSEIDHLDYLPKHLTKCIWDVLKRRCMLSFHSWKVLSKALHREKEVTFGMFHYDKNIQYPTSPLQVYIDPLISRTFDFITSLSININYSAVELVKLANILNLGILEVVNPDPRGETSSGIGDIVLRAWSREAEENGAFPLLRILRLWDHDDLTEKSLRYIGSFPALVVFDVYNSGINWHEKMVLEAEKIGWTTIPGQKLLYDLEEKCRGKEEKMFAGSDSFTHLRERTFERTLWPSAKVQRFRRFEIQSFFAQAGKNNLANWPNYVKDDDETNEWEKMSWDVFCRTKDNEPWESDLAACWARIGEVRDDWDLKAAGVKDVEQQTFVGRQVISPVPMAYIRLGNACQPLKRVREDMSTTCIPTTMDRIISSKSNFRLDLNLSRLNDGAQKAEASGGKRRSGGLGKLRSLKKQRLDDILNNFNPG